MARTSSGIEPIFMPYYERNRKTSYGEKFDFEDQNGERFKTFTVVHPGLKRFAEINEIKADSIKEWEEVYKKSPYYKSSAPDFDWETRVKIQSIIQQYVTHSISSTVNVDNKESVQTIDNIYINAWKEGLKGITVYRDGCRSGILNKVSEKKEEEKLTYIKRPKELEADFYTIKAKGEQFIVIVGLMNNRPYEVFAFRPKQPIKNSNFKGKIIKVKKRNYKFVSENLTIENLELENERIEEKASTLYCSMLLRHGADIAQITKVMKKVNENITSFSSAVCRILSKYVSKTEVKGEVCPNCGGRLVNEGGCVKCLDCDYSKCL